MMGNLIANLPIIFCTLLGAALIVIEVFLPGFGLPGISGIALICASVVMITMHFGLLTGATLGGNLTPIGASANITAIGILRKNGCTVTTKDFLRIGIPFTMSAVLVGYAFIWLFWGI